MASNGSGPSDVVYIEELDPDEPPTQTESFDTLPSDHKHSATATALPAIDESKASAAPTALEKQDTDELLASIFTPHLTLPSAAASSAGAKYHAVWRAVPTQSAPPARGGHTLTYLNGALYLFGGSDRTQRYFTDLQRLELSAESLDAVAPASAPKWTKAAVKSKKPPSRSGHTCVAWENQLVVYGGQHVILDSSGAAADGTCLHDVWCFDTRKTEWKLCKTSGGGNDGAPNRCSHGAVLIGSRMYVIGGSDATSNRVSFADIPVLNLEKMEWSVVKTTVAAASSATATGVKSAAAAAAPHPVGREMFACAAIGTTIVVAGGRAMDRYLDDFWLLDTQTLEWRCVAQVSGAPAMCGHTPFVFPAAAAATAAVTATATAAAIAIASASGSTNGASDSKSKSAEWCVGTFGGIDIANRMHDSQYCECTPAIRLAAAPTNGDTKTNTATAAAALIPDTARWITLPPPPAAANNKPAAPPAARFAHSLSAISGGRYVLFGGLNSTGDFNDLHTLTIASAVLLPPQQPSAAAASSDSKSSGK